MDCELRRMRPRSRDAAAGGAHSPRGGAADGDRAALGGLRPPQDARSGGQSVDEDRFGGGMASLWRSDGAQGCRRASLSPMTGSTRSTIAF